MYPVMQAMPASFHPDKKGERLVRKETNSPSGSVEKYDVDTDEIEEPQTTRAQTKSQAMVTSATPVEALQSENGDDTQSQKSDSGTNAEKRLESVIVRGRAVDISESTITQMLYGPDYQAPSTTTEFDHHREALGRVK
ncbi:hypothetical protein HAX54_001155 [Datura stramonium]|uniref:Uncharacterized protein n=1 Tax=Datura stramonium TaxID=4076 RepID=A0ABS8T1Y6_DATST|nr:hypothetical protein [Datura stramonium]